MLILCSNGLSSDEMLEAVRKHIGKAKKAAIVVTADAGYKEQDKNVPRCKKELEILNQSVDLIDIDKQNPHSLLEYDIVEFIGGNPYYLLNALRETNSKYILEELMATKILIGWSAGALVMGPSLRLVNMYTPEMNFLNLKNLDAMSLTDIEILPHYDRFLRKYNSFEEKCSIYENTYGVSVLRLNDGEGVLIDQNIQVVRCGNLK